MEVQELIERLWKLDAESDWTPAEAHAGNGGQLRLHKYLLEVLRALSEFVPHVSHSYVAIAGPKCGFFTPVAALHRNLDTLAATPTFGSGTLVATCLHDGNDITILHEPARSPYFKGDTAIRDKVVVKLQAHGEFFGFISLDSTKPAAFGESTQTALKQSLPVLTRTLSDAIFSMRLRLLAASFEAPRDPSSLKPLYNEIAERAAQGFAADGSVLRIYNTESQKLIVEAFHGDVDMSLQEDRGLSEHIAGTVFSSSTLKWALRSFGHDEEEQLVGVRITDRDEEELQRLGIRSYIVMKLISEGRELVNDAALGTLAIFHKRPHKFSWRDIALFKSFCQRVADTVALFGKNLQLHEIAETLRMQGQLISRVEIVALLAHDLGHKALNASLNVEDYIEGAKKALNDTKQRRNHHHLEERAELAMSSTAGLSDALDQIRRLYKTSDDQLGDPVEFDIAEALDDVESMMSGALTRNRIKIRRVLSGNLRTKGHRSILAQALLNLVINSIDAVRLQRNPKPSVIHVHAHEEKQGDTRKAIIQFWDEGPGVNRVFFPNPSDIFVIGKTSKSNGTGTGLPVTRNLLGQYFDGSLVLEDAETARFKITLPLK